MSALSLDRLVPPAQLAISLALDEAGNVPATPQHLLAGLAATPGSEAARVLGGARDEPYRFRQGVVPVEIREGQLEETTEAILRRAVAVADEMGHALVGTEHLLVALVELADTEVLRQLEARGISARSVRALMLGSAQ
jgi:ATP-dependent Clp protease ATP-binding subunit ClpA